MVLYTVNVQTPPLPTASVPPPPVAVSRPAVVTAGASSAAPMVRVLASDVVLWIAHFFTTARMCGQTTTSTVTGAVRAAATVGDVVVHGFVYQRLLSTSVLCVCLSDGIFRIKHRDG